MGSSEIDMVTHGVCGTARAMSHNMCQRPPDKVLEADLEAGLARAVHVKVALALGRLAGSLHSVEAAAQQAHLFLVDEVEQGGAVGGHGDVGDVEALVVVAHGALAVPGPRAAAHVRPPRLLLGLLGQLRLLRLPLLLLLQLELQRLRLG